jgi:hypothetical protein
MLSYHQNSVPLQKYECPVPYHAVRTRFLGTIVSPVESVLPIAILKGLWGGEFPAFDNLNALSELIQVLIMGLWNQLTRHQKLGQPFRFVELSVPRTLEGLATLALVRREEIDGFIDGLFGPAERIDLPESGYRALGEIGEIRAMLAGIYELATRPAKKGGDDVASLIDNVLQDGAGVCTCSQSNVTRAAGDEAGVSLTMERGLRFCRDCIEH